MKKFAFLACALALSGVVAAEAQAGCRPGLFSRFGGRNGGSCSSNSSCSNSTCGSCTVTTTKTRTVEKKAAPSPVTEKAQAPTTDKKAAPSLR